MRNITLGAALSALLVSLPVAGAFASDAGLSPEDRAYQASIESTIGAASAAAGVQRLAQPAVRSPVDQIYTSSITSQVGKAGDRSYDALLDGQLAAAQANLSATQDSFVDPAGASRVQTGIQAVRQAAEQDRATNGGQLSASAYQSLSAQLRTLNQDIHALNGG